MMGFRPFLSVCHTPSQGFSVVLYMYSLIMFLPFDYLLIQNNLECVNCFSDTRRENMSCLNLKVTSILPSHALTHQNNFLLS
jgi:hypothetical protein